MSKFALVILKYLLYPFALLGALLLFAFDKVDGQVRKGY